MSSSGRRGVGAVGPAVRREHHRRSLACPGWLEQEGRDAAGVDLADDRGGVRRSHDPPWLVSDRSRPFSTAHTSGGSGRRSRSRRPCPDPTESDESVVLPVVSRLRLALERDAPRLIAATPVHDREELVAVPARRRVGGLEPVVQVGAPPDCGRDVEVGGQAADVRALAYPQGGLRVVGRAGDIGADEREPAAVGRPDGLLGIARERRRAPWAFRRGRPPRRGGSWGGCPRRARGST